MSHTEPIELIDGLFVDRRTLAASPGQVFTAFSELGRRMAWFGLPGSESHSLDFRVGGRESIRATTSVAGLNERITWDSTYLDIAEGRRIVFGYRSTVDDRVHGVGLVTVQMSGLDQTDLSYGDRYTLYVYAGGADAGTTKAHHEGGTRLRLNGLKPVVSR